MQHLLLLERQPETGAVEGLSATKDVIIVPLDNDKIEALIEKYPYYAKETRFLRVLMGLIMK